jgi:signal transduction histidine kinase
MDTNHSEAYMPTAIRIEKVVRKILLILIIIPLLYLFIYWLFDPRGISIPLLILFFVLPMVVFALNRMQLYGISKYFGLIGYNVALFLVASSEPAKTGIYLHFVSCSAVAIVLFRFRERWKSLMFILFSTSLFLAVNLFDISILPYRELTREASTILFVSHTIGATLISVFCIFLLIKNNYRSKKNLIKTKELLEQKNSELEKANKELDRFVYSASHDLKAPLSSIQGLLSLLEFDKTTPAEDYIREIKKQAEQMRSFIQDIVHYSRNSRADTAFESVDLYDLINEVQKSFLHYENAGKIHFEIEVEKPCLVFSDRYRLKVILSNLISNAIKYTDLRKDQPFVRVTVKNSDDQHCIIIEDNGIGIEKSHLPRLFDMFYRASSNSQGSGLGLYIARESTQKINGTLDVQSEFGQGTKFILGLPVHVATARVQS